MKSARALWKLALPYQKPVKSACLLPPMECGKETVFSPGTISSTLHQVKFNCFHFLASLGISPVGGGAERKSWKSTSVFNTLHLGSVSFLPPLLLAVQLPAGKTTLEKPGRKMAKGKEGPGILLGRGKLTLKTIMHASIATVSHTVGTADHSKFIFWGCFDLHRKA